MARRRGPALQRRHVLRCRATRGLSPRQAHAVATSRPLRWITAGATARHAVGADPGGGLEDPGARAVLLQQVEQGAAVDEFDRLVLRELEGVRAVPAGGHENPLVRSFVPHRAVEVAHGRDLDGVLVALGLDHHLAAEDRPLVEGDAVDAAVARRARQLRLEPHLGEEVGHQGLELRRREVEQVGPRVQRAEHVLLGHETRGDHAHLDDGLHRQRFAGSTVGK